MSLGLGALFASLLALYLGLIAASRRWGGAKVDEWLFRHRDHLPIPFLSIGILTHLTSKKLTPTPKRGWMNLLGIFLVILGESLRIWAVGIVGAATRSKSTNAKRLVQEGPYAVIRNPIYAGNFLLCFGLACFLHSWAALLACVLYFIVVYDRIIRSEEKFLQATFGSVYETYCRFVPRMVPRWGGSREALRAPFRLKELRKEYWTVTGIACAVLVAHFMTFQPLHDWLADRHPESPAQIAFVNETSRPTSPPTTRVRTITLEQVLKNTTSHQVESLPPEELPTPPETVHHRKTAWITHHAYAATLGVLTLTGSLFTTQFDLSDEERKEADEAFSAITAAVLGTVVAKTVASQVLNPSIAFSESTNSGSLRWVVTPYVQVESGQEAFGIRAMLNF